MLKTRIIPCLDIKDGRVVKGINFLNLKDAGDPVEQAKIYDAQGADELCFLDISASIEKRKTLIDVVKKTADECFMPLTVGGGVGSEYHVEDLLKAGADKVSLNTHAVNNPKIINKCAKMFGNQCIVLAIDAKKTSKINIKSGFEVYTHGGKIATGIDAINWAKEVVNEGAGEILVTSMDRDGTKKGFDNDLIRAITTIVSVPVIASGGVGNLNHLVEGILVGGASAVLAASIFHFGEYTVSEAKAALASANISVRSDK
tara:strand:+ start:935 stop:1711 length:777 start_codon:yes stop_codon:yes gene_type:complete